MVPREHTGRWGHRSTFLLVTTPVVRVSVPYAVARPAGTLRVTTRYWDARPVARLDLTPTTPDHDHEMSTR